MNDEKRKRRIKNLVALLLAPVFAFVFLRWFEVRTVYQPSSRFDANGDELGYHREDVRLKTTDGVELHAWFFHAESDHQKPVFLICHGNGGNISHRLALYDVLLRAGGDVFAFDYRGYGLSGGRPGESGTYLDAAAAYNWLRNLGYAPDDIIPLGESLGGGVASQLAETSDVGGLILMSTFTSTEDIGSELFPWLPVRTVGKIKYPTLDRLPRIHVPVLIMHSKEDTIIPAHHADRNFDAANEPKLFQRLSGDHNDTFAVDRDAVAEGIERFLTLLNRGRKDVAIDSRSKPNAADADAEDTR